MRYAPPVGIDTISRSRNRRRRPRNSRRLSWKCWLSLFFIPAFVCGTASFALQTPLLLVKEVRIKGVRLSDRSRVENAAKAALGRNIILVRTGPIAAAISRLPEVERVVLARSFPDGLSVTIQERRADAILKIRDGYWMIRDDCLAFHRARGPVPGLPVVEVARCGPVRGGHKCASTDVANAVEVLKCARKCELSVAKISVDPLGDMCLNMGGGFYVKLGQPDDIARKMSILRTALTCRPSIAEEAAYIDLSCPSAPVWKPKSAS